MTKQQNETALIRFWREVSRELRALGERAPGLGEISTLYGCGYSPAQAVRALAPNRRPVLRSVSNF